MTQTRVQNYYESACCHDLHASLSEWVCVHTHIKMIIAGTAYQYSSGVLTSTDPLNSIHITSYPLSFKIRKYLVLNLKKKTFAFFLA